MRLLCIDSFNLFNFSPVSFLKLGMEHFSMITIALINFWLFRIGNRFGGFEMKEAWSSRVLPPKSLKVASPGFAKFLTRALDSLLFTNCIIWRSKSRFLAKNHLYFRIIFDYFVRYYRAELALFNSSGGDLFSYFRNRNLYRISQLYYAIRIANMSGLSIRIKMRWKSEIFAFIFLCFSNFLYPLYI